jgi:hypothetical protein
VYCDIIRATRALYRLWEGEIVITTDWKSVLKADPTDWLLEEENPSVRYFTLVDILGEPPDAPEVETTRCAIMKSGVVPRILARQQKGGYWGNPEDFYVRGKYRGTVWQLIILAELAADSEDPRIRKTCEFILENSQDRQSGGFAHSTGKDGAGNHDMVMPCLTANMVWSLIKFGYLDDPRVRRGIDWITTYQRFDDAVDEAPGGWPYDRYKNCWGKHTCHMGVVKALRALAEIPLDRRTETVKSTIEGGAEYLLRHHVHKRSHDLEQVANPRWLKYGFPLLWQIDVLEILGVLLKLGYREPRMREAVDLVIAKQDEQGRWLLENTFNGRFLVSIERKGRPSKWVTLNALRVLKDFLKP